MSIKSIVEYLDIVEGVEDADVLEEDERVGMKKTEAIFEEFRQNAESAKELILEKIDEKQFSKLLHMTQKVVSFIQIQDGDMGILLAEEAGDLRGYTHTVVLAVIGTLIKEEIL